jgi:quercetin dioxygenase-like cupin family protein
MGYVVAGKVTFTFTDGTEETYEAGDAYYAPPGHLPYLYAGSEVVEFSPSTELQKTLEVVERNMAAAGG